MAEGQGCVTGANPCPPKDESIDHTLCPTPNCRWQKGKDVYWYTRDVERGEAGAADELALVKQREADLMAEVRGPCLFLLLCCGCCIGWRAPRKRWCSSGRTGALLPAAWLLGSWPLEPLLHGWLHALSSCLLHPPTRRTRAGAGRAAQGAKGGAAARQAGQGRHAEAAAGWARCPFLFAPTVLLASVSGCRTRWAKRACRSCCRVGPDPAAAAAD